MEDLLAKINTSAVNFLMPLTPQQTYRAIVQEAKKLIDAQGGSIHLESRGNLNRVYTSDQVFLNVMIRKKANTFKAFSTKKVIIAYKKETLEAHPVLKKRDYKTFVFIPLSYKNKSIGVLNLYLKKQIEFSKRELYILTLFGSLASLAIRKTQLYNETKKLLDLKEKFISHTAHELRTPLTTMSGYIQLLHRKLKDKNTSESNWIESLWEETKRLTTMIEELLQINRMRAGMLEYHFAQCDVIEVVKKSIEINKKLFPDHILEFKSSSDTVMIIADKHKIMQAFSHILENASKFSDLGSKISIRISTTAANVVIRVADEGLGVAKEDLPYIFEGFFKGKNTTIEGIGVGLFYVKNTIENHKGDVQIDSRLNHGTVVKVTLPKIVV